MQKDLEKWDIIIRPQNRVFNLGLTEVWHYRDLLWLFVRRDFVALYKQTILGPVWFVLQPVISALVFTIIFHYFGKIDTDGIQPILFYLGGLTLWNYFSECLTKNADTFIQNQTVFGKIYFPRLIVPLSIMFSTMIKLGIQFLVFLIFWVFYFIKSSNIEPQMTILLFPLLIIILAGLSLGFGILFSSLTTKYRDVRFLLQFGIQLMMYLSSVVIPLSQIPEKYRWIIKLNPVVSVIETFKHGFLGTGEFDFMNLMYSFFVMIILIFVGLFLFNKIEKNFMDTV